MQTFNSIEMSRLFVLVLLSASIALCQSKDYFDAGSLNIHGDAKK